MFVDGTEFSREGSIDDEEKVGISGAEPCV